MKQIIGLILVGLLMTFGIANADENSTENSGSEASGYYTGIGIGTSSVDIDCGYRYGYSSYYRRSCNDDEISFKLFGGKSDIATLGPVDLGVEIAYDNLGEHENTEVDALSATAALRVNLPLSTALIARGGYAYWDAVDADTDTVWAAGIEKGWTHAFARIEFQRFDIEDTDFDVYMLSGGYKF